MCVLTPDPSYTGLTPLKMSVYCAVHGHVCVVYRECHFLVVSIITMLWFMYTPGVPLTPSNVMGAVEEVRRWWREDVGVGIVRGLAGWLYIPPSKQNQIKRNFPDVMEQKKQMISYWINTDPLAGWRRLITALDWMDKTQLADLIRSNAEPLTGSQVHNVHNVNGSMTRVCACMFVRPQQTNIHAGHPLFDMFSILIYMYMSLYE